MKRGMRRLFTIFFALFVASQLQSQNHVLLSDSFATRSLPLERFAWAFQPGDNPAWALPSTPDQNWPKVSPNFGKGKEPTGWTGAGWFRIWLQKRAGTSTNSWGMYINQDGASEIYIDGQKRSQLGQFSTDPNRFIPRRNPYGFLPIALTDTLPHLLAIRYENFRPAFDDFTGFQAWISEAQHLTDTQKKNQHFYDLLLMSGSAMAILVLLHILLFSFYPKQKINLWYSLFVSVTAVALFSRSWAISTTDPHRQLTFYKVFSICIATMPFFFALLPYSLGRKTLPKTKLAIIAGISAAFSIWFLAGKNTDLLSNTALIGNLANVFIILVMIDALLVVGKAIRDGNRRLWLIAGGLFVVVIGSVFIGANIFNWFTFHQVMAYMALICLVMPVLFSIYIAMEVASTNRALETQLDRNEQLAAENLQRERDKSKFMRAQSDLLEKTVEERTAQVRRQAEQLREMDAAKSRFFVNLTHEFKTPLTLIINPAKELLRQPDAAAARQYAQFILQNSERLLQLINQLLDLSRIENGQMTISAQSIDLLPWTQLHVEQFQSLAEHQQLQLSFSTDIKNLPVDADTDKLEKMLHNLLSNAIKFSTPGGHISVELRQPDSQHYSWIVTDEGIGIDAAQLPKIFDRFYQADASDTRKREGTGIGLALVKELVTLLQGTIQVESEPGVGSKFTITLPLVPAARKARKENIPLDDVLNEEPVEAAVNANTPAFRLVIAEDNLQLRRYLELTLRDRYQVIMATDGQEGIDLAIEHVPNLVLTDLMMPLKNGYEVCDTLKKDPRTSHIPIIMLTAKTDLGSRIRGLETGADAYLSKPFDKEELFAQIDNLIAGRAQLRERYSKGLLSVSDMPSMEQVFLDRVKSAIVERLDDAQLSAESLGRDIGLSRTQLHRKLKDLVDQSPGELIRQIRMQHALELLQKNVATVAEVGYRVGYGNPGNFSTSFTKHFGFPPSEARSN